MYAAVKVSPLAPGVRYFLLAIKCVSHQINLAAKGAVMGPAAAVGRNIGSAPRAVTDRISGAATRLFKYLCNDYYEEFAQSVRDWVGRDLRLVSQPRSVAQFCLLAPLASSAATHPPTFPPTDRFFPRRPPTQAPTRRRGFRFCSAARPAPAGHPTKLASPAPAHSE